MALTSGLLPVIGCGSGSARLEASAAQPDRPQVLVVAPVINLSSSADFDPLRVTDLLAAEFLCFPHLAVVPVNLTLAALARQGKARVETGADALALARELGADATIVTAVTEYDPYDPPLVGLVMQWYAPSPPPAAEALDPVGASRQAAAVGGAQPPPPPPSPRWQVQRVFDAARGSVLEQVRSFAAARAGRPGPYAWRRYVKSQELFVRYCCWATIKTMLETSRRSAAAGVAAEAEQR